MNLPRLLSHSPQTRKFLLHPLTFLQFSTYSSSSSSSTTTKRIYTKKQPKISKTTSLVDKISKNVEISKKVVEGERERNWPRPSEIPWQGKVANVVNLIGRVSMPVQFQVSADGKSWAGTILTQESSSSDSLLWIPIIFEGDLAHIAACHLKEKDFVHVSGQLAGDPPQFTMEKSRSSSIQVMVNGINFVEESPQRKESHASYKQNEQATSSSLTHSETTSMPITEDKKDSTTTEHLWTDLLENPHEWWDNRLNKNNLKGADFKHKVKGETLWLDESTPGWVVSKLESLNFINKTVQKSQKSVNGVKDRESVECSWRDLTYNPNRWRDHRKEKLNGQVNPKFPDFKHKDSGQALWISSAPKWVLSNLDALKFDNKGNFQKKKFDDKENSWKDLVENPNKWWDNRFDKLNQRAPDFKHKETGEGLWLSGSPDWVMPKLPPVKSKDVAGSKRETLLS